MISFLPLNDGDEREIVEKLVGIIPDADGEEMRFERAEIALIRQAVHF